MNNQNFQLIIISIIVSLSFSPVFNCESYYLKPKTRVNVGITMDLNTTSQYHHPEIIFNISKTENQYMTGNEFIDIEGDGNKDLILFIMNVTYFGEDYDIQNEIWIIKGPLYENKTYDEEIIKWIYPNETWNPYLIDLGTPDKYDLILVDEGSEFHKGSVMIYPFGKDPSDPWSERTCKIDISNEWNGTACDIQAIDTNLDGFNDLLVHKEISYVYTTPPPPGSDEPVNHTKLKKRLLILDGSKTASGNYNESIFSTVIDSDWVPGQGNSTFTGKFSILKNGEHFSIINSDVLYILPNETEQKGRIFSFDPIDLNYERYELSKIITHDIKDLSGIGGFNKVSTISLDPKQDYISIWSGGYRFFDTQVLYENTTGPKLNDCIFWTADADGFHMGDFNGDNSNDIFCSFPYYTISTRQQCGAINIGMNYSKYSGKLSIEDLQDMTIIGSESYSMIGSYYFGFFVDDIDKDGFDDIILRELKNPFTYFVIKGRGEKPPIVEDIGIDKEPIYRGGTFDLEVFGSDSQNFNKYIQYEINIRESGGEWSQAEIIDTDVNWSDEKPYLGSKIFTIQVPVNFEVGPFDIKVRATNTFNLTSEWKEFPSIGVISNSQPKITARLEKDVLKKDEVTNIIGTVTDMDSTGPFGLKLELWNGSTWNLDSVSSIKEGNNTYIVLFRVNETLLFGMEYLLRMKVTDPDGGTGTSGELHFIVLPNSMSFNITDVDPRVFRGEKLTVHYELDTEVGSAEISLDSDSIPDTDINLSSGSGYFEIMIPVDSEIGLMMFNYNGNDGYSTVSGDFQTDVLNNLPWLHLPEEIEVNGSHSFLIEGLFGDREDSDNVELDIIGEYTGLEITYFGENETLFFNIKEEGTWEVLIRITDRDGGITEKSINVTGNKKETEKPYYPLSIRVLDNQGNNLPDAVVILVREGVEITSNVTDEEGMTEFLLTENSNLILRVEPPSELSWIAGERSGLVKKELNFEFQTTLFTVQLDYVEAILSTNGTLTVNVEDQRGLPIADASVRISGPISQTEETDASGSALFDDLLPGIYTIDVLSPDGGKATKQVTIGESEDKVLDIIIEIEKDREKNDNMIYYVIPIFVAIILLVILLSVYVYNSKTKKGHIEE